MKKSCFIAFLTIGAMSYFVSSGLILPSYAQGQWLAETTETQSTSQTDDTATPDWQSYTSTIGRYSVELPVRPTQFTSITEVAEGTLTWQVAEVRIPPSEQRGTEYYLVAYTDLSTDHLASKNPDEIIQEVSNAVMAEGGLENSIQLQEKVLFHDHPARMVIGAVEEQYWVMVLSLINGRLYTSLAFSAQRDRMTHFLDSLEFADSSPAN